MQEHLHVAQLHLPLKAPLMNY